MSDFNPLAPTTTQPHPDKRLRYSLGLVLGADDLTQEQFYFLGRDRLHARRLHGYGTVCGLRVSVDGFQVTVGTGLAVDARGRLIRVTREHRGDVHRWWERQEGSPLPDRVHVVLCYRECESDTVPVAGTPCRTEEESQAPSRITESFQLLFTDTPPAQTEEEAIDRLGDLLRSIEIVEDEVSPLPEPYLDEAALGGCLDAVVNDSPLPAGPLWVRREEFEALMARLMELWLTEYLPRLADPIACVEGTEPGSSDRCDPESDAVLLATLQLDVEGMPTGLSTNERPLLYSTRLLQEYLLRRDQVVGDHGVLNGLEDDDHHQYLSRAGADAGRDNAMTGDLQMDGHKVVSLAEVDVASAPVGEAVPSQQVVKVGDEAQKDLRGYYPAPEVDGIIGRPIDEEGRGRPLTDSVLLYKRGVHSEDDRWELHRTTLGLMLDVVTTGREDGDHLVYWDNAWRPVAPAGDVTSDLSDPDIGPQLRVTGLQGIPVEHREEGDLTDNQVLTYRAESSSWAPMDPPSTEPIPPAGGDVTGPYDDLQVVGLQGRSIGEAAPVSGDVLTFYPDEWNPRPVRELPFATLTYIGRSTNDSYPMFGPIRLERQVVHVLEVWFHLDAPGNEVAVEIGDIDREKPQVQFFIEWPESPFVGNLKIEMVTRLSRNLYLFGVSDEGIFIKWQDQLDTDPYPGIGIPVRATFWLERLVAQVAGMPSVHNLQQWTTGSGITFTGMDAKRETVTRFVRVPIPEQA